MMRVLRAAVGIALALLVTSSAYGVDESVAQIRETPPSWMGERDDPRADGWGSEVYSDAVASRLVSFAGWMQGDAEFPEDLAHPSFYAGSVVPTELQSVHESHGLEVRRPSRMTRMANLSTGVGALRSVVASMMAPLGETGSRHVKFKLVGVEPKPEAGAGGVTTRLRLQVWGTDEESVSHQLNAVWLCDWLPSSDGSPTLASIDVEEYEEVALHGASSTIFSDRTEAVIGQIEPFRRQLGYGTEYWMRRLQSVLGIDNYGHQGLAVADVNGDGLEDLYVPQSGGMPNLLLIQNSDGSARELAAGYGVDFMDRTHGALFLDLDNDGDQDLALSTQHALLLLRNVAGEAFELVSKVPISGYSVAAADYDLDGDLDLYVTSYVGAPEWERLGGLGLEPIPYHDANNGAPNALIRNDGDWTFTNVTVETGMDVNNRRWSFAAAWADYDDDGDQDLYVANDFGRNNLYRNDGDRFVDVAAQAGVEDSASGMSAAWGDFDGDGLIDLYVGNMFSAAGKRIVPQEAFRPGASSALKADFKRFARGNTLYRNVGNGEFVDVSESAGVTMGRWSWSSPFVDLDNDGRQDLVVANGYLTNEHKDDL